MAWHVAEDRDELGSSLVLRSAFSMSQSEDVECPGTVVPGARYAVRRRSCGSDSLTKGCRHPDDWLQSPLLDLRLKTYLPYLNHLNFARASRG